MGNGFTWVQFKMCCTCPGPIFQREFSHDINLVIGLTEFCNFWQLIHMYMHSAPIFNTDPTAMIKDLKSEFQYSLCGTWCSPLCVNQHRRWSIQPQQMFQDDLFPLPAHVYCCFQNCWHSHRSTTFLLQNCKQLFLTHFCTDFFDCLSKCVLLIITEVPVSLSKQYYQIVNFQGV